jgi:hypothetical protein
MPTNQFVPVATGSGANVRTYSQWAGTAVQVTGVQTGIVASKDMNTAWRQGTTMASVLGQMIVNRVGIDATDDGNVPGLLANVERGIAAMIDPSRYAEDSGQINTVVATLSPAPVALTPFLSVRIRIQYANTATAPTLNLNGFGPLTIVRQDGSPLAAGDLKANRIVNFVYDRVANVWRIGGPADSDLLGATYISAPTTKTVGGAGADFANLNLALAWLSNYRISATGSVTFLLGVGQFVYSGTAATIFFQHPDGRRVAIQAQALAGSQPVGSTLAYTGNTASARAADTATDLVTLRAVYKTEIVLQSGAYFFGTGNLGNLQDILITSDGTAGADCCLWNLGGVTLTRMAFVGAGGRGFACYETFVNTAGLIYGIGNGVQNFSIQSASAVAQFSGSSFIAMSGGGIGIQVAFASFSGVTGTGTVYVRGNNGDGVQGYGAQINLSSTSTSGNNIGAGYAGYDSGALNAIGSAANNNGASGYVANGVVKMDATNTTGAGNTGFGYYSAGQSFITRSGGTCTGAQGAASPAVGSAGNGNATII